MPWGEEGEEGKEGDEGEEGDQEEESGEEAGGEEAEDRRGTDGNMIVSPDCAQSASAAYPSSACRSSADGPCPGWPGGTE
ncbi:hypothetical protein [Actinoplanes rectilineatus]|uniref:hypothetical protein n=1 Tax=Actinoplanes rectilineatus TaxID=113571 RepID=UPI0006986EA3|nr:hypothetical protein [Actinoplanes rectilineatus]